MRQMMHMFVVLLTSVAVVVAMALGGNVLCFGNDGHIAIESPHAQGMGSVRTVAQGEADHADEDHGPCHDLSAKVKAAARPAAGDVVKADLLVAPLVAMLPLEAGSLGGGPVSFLRTDALALPDVVALSLRGIVMLN